MNIIQVVARVREGIFRFFFIYSDGSERQVQKHEAERMADKINRNG